VAKPLIKVIQNHIPRLLSIAFIQLTINLEVRVLCWHNFNFVAGLLEDYSFQVSITKYQACNNLLDFYDHAVTLYLEAASHLSRPPWRGV